MERAATNRHACDNGRRVQRRSDLNNVTGGVGQLGEDISDALGRKGGLGLCGRKGNCEGAENLELHLGVCEMRGFCM